MNTDQEHIIFSRMVESIGRAAADARELQRHRPDQPWERVAAKLDEFTQLLYASVGDGHVKGIIQ